MSAAGPFPRRPHGWCSQRKGGEKRPIWRISSVRAPFLALLMLAGTAAWSGGTATAASPSEPTAGLTLAFHQTFSGTRLDTAAWSTCYPWFRAKSGCTNYGNPPDTWYLPSADKVSGGALHLVATETPTRGFTKSGSHKTFPYASGMVTTKKSFDFTYGYVRIAAKVPGGTGTWPALWLLPKSEGWPPEIDIMENWGSVHTIQTTVIWSASGAVADAYKSPVSPSSLTTEYHTYGLLWEPGSLTWYLDGKVVDTYTGAYVPHQPMYFLADLAIDGRAASGSSFSIRSVKIYK
jgi:beta-glucanase (GH16 family)